MYPKIPLWIMSKKFEHDWVCSFKSDPTNIHDKEWSGTAIRGQFSLWRPSYRCGLFSSRLTCVCLYKSSDITPTPALVHVIQTGKLHNLDPTKQGLTLAGGWRAMLQYSWSHQSKASVLLFIAVAFWLLRNNVTIFLGRVVTESRACLQWE